MAGPQCHSNPPRLDPNSGIGHVEILGGLNSYVTGSLNSDRAILLVTDIYGFEAPLTRKIADEIAAAGFYVVVPDLFYGDPFDDNSGRPLSDWLKEHPTSKGFEDAKSVIESLRNKGVSATGAGGFCWGGKTAVELAKVPLVRAVVMCHPSFVTVNDIKKVKVPVEVLDGEFDEISPPELVKQFEEVLAAKPQIDSFVKIFPGVGHGFTVRYDEHDEYAVKIAEEAHAYMINWFVNHVKPKKGMSVDK